jgi:hypothetical protein
MTSDDTVGTNAQYYWRPERPTHTQYAPSLTLHTATEDPVIMDAQGPDHSGTLANRYTILLIATQITGLCHTRLFLLPVSIFFINEYRNGDDTPEIWASLCVTKKFEHCIFLLL